MHECVYNVNVILAFILYFTIMFNMIKILSFARVLQEQISKQIYINSVNNVVQ